MSLSDDKRNIFTTIGSYTSVMSATKMPTQTDIFPSINNKKDIVPFLLDVLKVVAGTDALQELTGQLFTKFIDKIEKPLSDSLKNQTAQYNAGNGLSTNFTTGTGIRVKVKDIDIKGDLKINPNSAIGDLKYSSTTLDFNKTAYDAIQNAGTETRFGSALTMKYDAATDEMIFKENPALGTTIGTWANAYINDIAIINKKQFLTNVMDKIYGTVSKVQGRAVNDVYNELVVNKLIEQLMNDDESFELSPADNAELLQRAEEIINGIVYYDMGCGVMGASLSLSGLTNLINSISGSTDPFYTASAITATIDQSIENKDVASANKQTIKDGFFQRLIKLITQALAEAMTTTPQIRALLSIISAFQNNGQTQIGNPKDDLKKFKTLLICVIKTAMKLINEFIFNLIKVFLVKLLVPLIQVITKEKITQYSGILKSLIPLRI